MAGPDELIRLTATQAVAALRRREVSPLDLVEASIARIEAVDGAVNAMPTRCFERARDHARRMTEQERSDIPLAGWLGGLPIAIKDLTAVAGVRTTMGSSIFSDNIPARSDILVERLEDLGGIVMGKTNTPEFGASGNTWNQLFGQTENPWKRGCTPGGSSGGSAVAVATGQVWLAHGTDFSGSLRQPAGYNAVVGFRPSPGRVPRGPSSLPFGWLSVNGPMARNVPDVALFLDAMSGYDPADPLSFEDGLSFAAATRQGATPTRVGFSADLGILPVERQTREISARAVQVFAEMGAEVEEAAPDFSGARALWHAFRSVQFVTDKGVLRERYPEALRPEILAALDQAGTMTAHEIAAAERRRHALFADVSAFFEAHDLLVCPPVPVPPWPHGRHFVDEVEGQKLADYLEYLAFCYAISLTGCPSLVLPVGFNAAGLPVGLQLVGPPRGEAKLLAMAARYEAAIGISGQLPIDPRG